MASFQTHLYTAAVGSLGATALCLQSGAINPTEALILISIGTLAGILPDVDSDPSVPTRILFNLIGFVVAVSVLISLQGHMHAMLLFGLSLAGGLLVRYVIYPVFTSITEHRGLFHSLPAAILLALATLSTGLHILNWPLDFTWLAAAFAGGGYMLHLLLDELFSVDFMGRRLKQSFGSALTLFSSSAWLSYLFLYALAVAGLRLLPMPFH